MEVEDLLHNLLIDNLPHDKFSEVWEEEIGHFEDEVCVEIRYVKLPKLGKSTIHVFRGGLVALESSRGKWSAFETLERVQEREYLEEWARYCRGGWTMKIPQDEGIYATKTLEGTRSRDRTLRRFESRLKDITCCGGFCSYGQVSAWQGWWFEYPTPRLKGAL